MTDDSGVGELVSFLRNDRREASLTMSGHVLGMHELLLEYAVRFRFDRWQ